MRANLQCEVPSVSLHYYLSTRESSRTHQNALLCVFHIADVLSMLHEQYLIDCLSRLSPNDISCKTCTIGQP